MLEKKFPFKKKLIFLISWVSELWIFTGILNLVPFYLHLSYIYMRGSVFVNRNTDPDPKSSWIRIQYGSGSTTLLTSCLPDRRHLGAHLPGYQVVLQYSQQKTIIELQTICNYFCKPQRSLCTLCIWTNFFIVLWRFAWYYVPYTVLSFLKVFRQIDM